MEPQPQLQPIDPKPQFQYAEPPPRPLELKPGPRPLDLRPRPSNRPQLDLKYGPASPAEQAAARANPLGNPLRVVEPILNNPLGYTPAKGLIGIGATFLDRATDPATFGVPSDEFEPSGIPLNLPSPFLFPLDAIDPGPLVAEPEPIYGPSPFEGGQCYGVPYNFEYHFTNFNGQPEVAYRSAIARILGTYTGDINAGGFQQIGFLTEGAPGTGPQKTHVATLYPGQQSNPSIQNVTRQDGLPDTCGNPLGPQIGETEPEYIPNPARAATAPSASSLPSPGTRERTPFLPIPTFRLPALPSTSPEFVPYAPPSEPDAPEIRPVEPSRPTAPTKFPPPATAPELPGKLDDPATDRTGRKLIPPFIPVLPGTTPPELQPPTKTPPFLIPIPPLRRSDCCADEAVMRESQRIRDILEDLKDRILSDCQDLCGPALMTATECQEVEGKLQPVSVFRTVLTLSEGLELLAAEIATINQQLDPCPQPNQGNVDPSLLSSGSMTAGATVAYVNIPDEVRQVELIITGTVPTDIRLYDTTLAGEQQGKFGSICVAYPGVTGGNAPDAFHQWAWTRRTILNIDKPLRAGRKIRIYLRAGLSWVLYDTGVRN